MSSTPPQDDQKDTDTGPQGTRVFRREDVDQYLTERRGNEAAAGVPSGAAFMGVNGDFRGQRFHIPSGRSTLGRDLANDIVIDADSVSLVHARLVEKDGQWRVLNLLSTNGTWVNDKKVSDSVLRDGDKVCFGEAEFVFQQTSAPAAVGFLGFLRRLFGGG